MFNKLKQVKDLRDKAKTLQSTLSSVHVEGSSAWGKIKVLMDGNSSVENIEIDDTMLADKGKLQDALKEAYNDACKKAQRKMVEKMKESGDLNIPGIG